MNCRRKARYPKRSKGNRFSLVLATMWVGWVVYWAIAARGAKATRWRAPFSAHWLHYAARFVRHDHAHGAARHPGHPGTALPTAEPDRCIARVALAALGLGVPIAARITLAGNWSAAVEIKENHALIRSGLYRHVCHPIYCSSAPLGFALLFASLSIKSRHEETRLRQILPG